MLSPFMWAGGLSFATTVLAIAAARPLARRVGLVDRPDGHRKLHAIATPLVGGLAMFLAMLAVVGGMRLGLIPGIALNEQEAGLLAGLFWSALALLIVGMVDDRFRIRGRHKLLGQIAAASMLVAAGLMVRSMHLFGWQAELGVLAVPFTIFWLLGAVNSFNLLDGMDGLAGAVGLFQCVALAALALMVGRETEAVLAICLASALLGFLCFNLPPARIFMGDAGSMLVGLATGVLALRVALSEDGSLGLAIPLAIWAVPVFDSLAAILRRKLTGRSVYTTDRGHLHHCLLARFGGMRRVLLIVAGCCTLTVSGAVLSEVAHSDLPAVSGVILTAGVLIVTKSFGYAESLLLLSRLKNLAKSTLQLSNHGQSRPVEASVQLQGSRQWSLLWESLTEFADKLNLVSMHLNVNLPAVQEGYHASWRRSSKLNPDDLWRTEVPLFSGNRAIGRLAVSGESDGASACELIEKLMDLLRPYETQLVQLAQSPAHYVPEPHAVPLSAGLNLKTALGSMAD